MSKMPIADFVSGLRAALNRKDGYIMGATGQDPKRWATNSWWYTQYSGEQKEKALYWRKHAARVWDCNGMAEGLYKDFSGVDINTKARYNYSQWCDPKGTGIIPEAYRTPGAAVFIHSSSSGYITHVGYLDQPTGDGDWYVIEARGVMYGVVRTRLSERGWNRWGLMTKYFEYDGEYEPPEAELGARLLKRGMSGDDVKELQELLMQLGYDLPRYGADGDYGDETVSAVKAFQRQAGLTADGVYGAQTHAALMAATDVTDEPDIDDAQPDDDTKYEHTLLISAEGRWNVRSGPGTEYSIVTVVSTGAKFEHIATAYNGWHCIRLTDSVGWVSPKCGKVIE